MRILLFCVLMTCGESLLAQSILDTLSRPTQSADTELLNQANQVAVDQANAAAKRASLLSRRANELRSQLDQLEKELEAERAEHAALKTSVSEFHKMFLSLASLTEKQALDALPAQIARMRDFAEKTLLPRLTKKQTPSSKDKNHKGEQATSQKPTNVEAAPDSSVAPRTDLSKEQEPSAPAAAN